MFTKRSLVAVLATTTCLTVGAAYAAEQSAPPPMSARQKTAEQDIGKLSATGAKAYMEVNAARLAIFDGRTKDAKTLIGEANADMAKAKSDDTAFMKAEADMKGSQAAQAGETNQTASKQAASNQSASNADKADSGKPDADDQTSAADMKTPKAWLPVDGEMTIDEDLSASPAKKAAVADANKSLEKGDKTGAIEKLKVANVDIDYAIAVVPLKQTMDDVSQAETLVNQGKYYEASQMLRDVQDSTRYDVLDIDGVPKKAASNSDSGAPSSTAKPMTH